MIKETNYLHQIPSFQEYLEKIYRININNDINGVFNSNLAKKLNITPSSVYEMLNKLKE